MKIQPTDFAPGAIPPKARELRKPPESAQDQVALSKTSRILQESSAEDLVDVSRVAQLREQIAAGTYQIDDNDVAKALLSRELNWKPPQS